MKRQALVLTAAVFAAVLVSYAAIDTFMGTWKLNETRSTLTAGAEKNSMVVYAADGTNIKVTIDGTGADGKAYHSEWTGRYDGKDHAVTGDPTTDMRAYKMVNARTLSVASKKDGTVINNTRIVISVDGKTRTVTTTGVDPKGHKTTTSTSVYERQ